METLQIFSNPEFGEVRTINENGIVLFCGSDVARALGYARPNEAIASHAKGTVKRSTPTNGGIQEMSFIPEPDLYRLIFRSKLPSAERFTDWVTEEVLPSIRQRGGYLAEQETLSPEELMAKALMVAQRTMPCDYICDSCVIGQKRAKNVGTKICFGDKMCFVGRSK